MPGGRPKGYPKTGGRKKGTPNTFSRERFIETLHEHGIDPTVGLIKLLPKLLAHQRAGVYAEWQRILLGKGTDPNEDGQRTPSSPTPAQTVPTDELLRRVLQATANAHRDNTATGSR